MVEQLRGHCAAQLAELEQSVGSHHQLLEALRRSCPLQVSSCLCLCLCPCPCPCAGGSERLQCLWLVLTLSLCFCPQATLNKDYVETLSEAKELLRAKLEDHASLQEEVGLQYAFHSQAFGNTKKLTNAILALFSFTGGYLLILANMCVSYVY